jgi:hypothetical protein
LTVECALQSLPAEVGAMFSFSPKAFGATIAIERSALDPLHDTLDQPLGQDRDAARFRPFDQRLVASALIDHESVVVSVL